MNNHGPLSSKKKFERNELKHCVINEMWYMINFSCFMVACAVMMNAYFTLFLSISSPCYNRTRMKGLNTYLSIYIISGTVDVFSLAYLEKSVWDCKSRSNARWAGVTCYIPTPRVWRLFVFCCSYSYDWVRWWVQVFHSGKAVKTRDVCICQPIQQQKISAGAGINISKQLWMIEI